MFNYTKEELEVLLGSVGENPQIHKSVLFFYPKKITIGDNVRIDAHSILTGPITFGNYIHLGPAVHILGGEQVIMEDYTGLAAKVNIFSASDDYSDGYMTGPQVPIKYRKKHGGTVWLRKHAVVGCGSVLLPGVTLGIGSSVGALSVVKKDVPDFMVAAGNPAKVIKERGRLMLDFEKEMI